MGARALPAPMKRRAPRSSWTAAENAILNHLLYVSMPYGVNYEQATALFEGRTAEEIKRRCACIRDLKRRKERKKDLAARKAIEKTQEGALHPSVVWKPTTCDDIEPIWVF